MFAAGGLALIAADRIRKIRCKAGKTVRSSLCACVFTLIELAFGLALNVRRKARVWDYSDMPLNYKGQICVPFSLMWAALSFPAMGVCTLI